jgi:hypothetical protein
MKASHVAAGCLLALAGAAHAGEPQTLRFEEVFRQDDGLAPLHYRASYAAGDAQHQLEAWVDRGTRLKRVTDAALEVHAERAQGDDDFRMTVLDRRRGIATRVDRTSLYRMGNFTDWFELAQGLRHPRGAYRLAASPAPAGAPEAVEPCDWYALTQEGRTTQICWSTESRLPVLVLSAEGRTVWRVTQVDRDAIAAQQFEMHDQGYVHNDATRDVQDD